MKKDLPKKIAALVEGIDHVCYRYRLHAFEPYLNFRGWRIETYPIPRGVIASLRILGRIRDADVVFLQRRLPIRPYLRLLRRDAKRLVFDFDDAVFRRDSFARKGQSRKLKRRFKAIAGTSDAMIAGNEFLADCALQFSDPAHVVSIPTCIETKAFERENDHSACVSPNAAMVLVWIGSSSTLPLLSAQAEILNRIARKFSPIHLKVICDSFPVFQHMPVQAVPWSEKTEIRELASSHVGISWLPEDEWGKGKCGLKVLQYMAAGLPVLANPFGVHLEMIEHGKNGFLPETPEDWIHALKRLRNDPVLAKEMGAQGRQIVQARYSVSLWAESLHNVLSGSERNNAGNFM